MTRSNSKQPRRTRSNAAQTILATYAAAAKQPKKKMTVKQQKEKNQQDTKLPKELLSSDEEEIPSDSEDDNTSSTSKKREREDDNIVKRKKKTEMDTSMEADEEIAIVEVKAGVAKKPAAKKTPPKHGKQCYLKHGKWLTANRPTEESSIQRDAILHRIELTVLT